MRAAVKTFVEQDLLREEQADDFGVAYRMVDPLFGAWIRERILS